MTADRLGTAAYALIIGLAALWVCALFVILACRDRRAQRKKEQSS